MAYTRIVYGTRCGFLLNISSGEFKNYFNPDTDYQKYDTDFSSSNTYPSRRVKSW